MSTKMKLSRKSLTNFYMSRSLLILVFLSIASRLSTTTDQQNCPDGFYNHYRFKKLYASQTRLETIGHSCSPCNCNQLGSLSTTCNKNSGTCYCAYGYTGIKCNKCASGFVKIENENFRNNISTICRNCGECYKTLLFQLEDLKLSGIELIKKASDVTESKVVILKSADAKVVHLLNSSRLQITENIHQEPQDLDGLVRELDISFLETKEYSDKLSQMTTDLESFLEIQTHNPDTNLNQIEYLISSLNLMEDILDGHIYSYTIKKRLFKQIKQKNDKLSPFSLIESASNQSCEMALVVGNLKQILKTELLKDDLTFRPSDNYDGTKNDDVSLMNQTSPLSDLISLNRQKVVYDEQLGLQQITDELRMTALIIRDVGNKIEQILSEIETGAQGISQKFRKRMLNIFRESELMREELNKNLNVSIDLQEVFAKNAQTLSRQHEDLISLHKRMDEILQSLRYSQFRCDKFM